jgi:hypothetical protein
MNPEYKYHHIGIPTTQKVPGMVHHKHLKIWATDHESNPYGIQWMLYERDCEQPELIRTVTHVAFEVDDLTKALAGKKIITPPNSPSPGVMVAMIEEAGAPVELLQYEKKIK